MKRESATMFCLLICFSFLISVQLVSSDLVQDWQVELNDKTRTIGVDDENNLLLFYISFGDDLTKTRLIKYSTAGEIVYNESMDFGSEYFLYTQKWMDFAGNLYLVGISTEDINIYVFDNQLTPSNYLFLNESDFEGIVSLSELFVTNMGNIFLRTSYYSFLYNSTHFEKKDHLSKLDAEGNIVWTNDFQAYFKPSSNVDNFVSDYNQDYCFFSYQNRLYKIKYSNGRILWEREFSQNIKGIAASLNGVAVVLGDEGKYTPLTLQYLSTKGNLEWSKTINSDNGYLNFRKVEAKEYSICLSVSDLGDDGESGPGDDRVFIYNLDGEELMNQRWEYDSAYLFDQKLIHQTNNNSIFVHNTDLLPIPDGSTFIRFYSFKNNMTSIAAINGFFIELTLFVIILSMVSRQSYKKIRKENQTRIISQLH